MTKGRRTALAACLVVLAAPLAGCKFERVQPEPTSTALIPMLDPCAERLHDIAGTLLLHCAATGELPPDTAAIKRAGGEACPPLECPVSREPYVYNPAGLSIPDQSGLLVLYDAKPSHNGKRWGLIVGQAVRNKPLEVRVILLPDNVVASPKNTQNIKP